MTRAEECGQLRRAGPADRDGSPDPAASPAPVPRRAPRRASRRARAHIQQLLRGVHITPAPQQRAGLLGCEGALQRSGSVGVGVRCGAQQAGITVEQPLATQRGASQPRHRVVRIDPRDRARHLFGQPAFVGGDGETHEVGSHDRVLGREPGPGSAGDPA